MTLVERATRRAQGDGAVPEDLVRYAALVARQTYYTDAGRRAYKRRTGRNPTMRDACDEGIAHARRMRMRADTKELYRNGR